MHEYLVNIMVYSGGRRGRKCKMEGGMYADSIITPITTRTTTATASTTKTATTNNNSNN